MEVNKDITLFAKTNFRNEQRKFGIKLDDRRRHFYSIGKTGMGKTVLLENMFLSDVYAGHGCCYVDPHGDTAERLINYIPPWRVNDVVYFNPADTDYPVGFNILETVDPEHKHLVAAGLMGVFKKIWIDQWSARMEYILNNTILALMDTPGSTLLGINRMYADKNFRKKIVANIKDPIVRAFWVDEYAGWDQRYEREATAAIQNKIGQFVSASIIRNIVAQVKSTLLIREIMDAGKILIANLSKGRIGEDNSHLLGGMLITKIQLSAMERIDIPEAERRDFFLFVDEFQHFATESFANILSEARKYHLGLVIAHQYIEQLDESVAAAVFGNVGTITCFRVGAADAEVLEKEFEPQFTREDLVNLPKWKIYLRLMIDGVASQPFSADTLPPIAELTNSSGKVISVSRERYGRSRVIIEEKVAKWSGMMEEGAPKKEVAEKKNERLPEDTKEHSGDRNSPSSAKFSGDWREMKKGAEEKKSASTFQNSGSEYGKKKRRRRKKKGNSPIASGINNTGDIIRDNPNQKGISLNDLKQHGKSDSNHRPDVQRQND